jgi:hypothetical protein
MDFIEKLLGFSPDGGNGSAEVTVLVALMLAVTFLVTFPTYLRFHSRQERPANRGTV